MSIIASVNQFLGYDKPSNSVPVYVDGQRQLVTPPLPNFRFRSMTNSAEVLDGQTLVLRGPVSETILRMKDKVPVLGDIPLVGRLWRSESQMTEKKQLAVLITPTLIDAAGNQYHSEEDLPRK